MNRTIKILKAAQEKNVYRQLEYDKPSTTTVNQMVKNNSENNVYRQLEYDKPSSTTFSQMVKNHSEEKVRAWLTSEKNIHNSMEQDNEFNILDLTDADIVMLDSTPEKFHESAYNPDVLIEVPYNIVIQDIENVDQTPVISTNNSVIDISLQNVVEDYTNKWKHIRDSHNRCKRKLSTGSASSAKKHWPSADRVSFLNSVVNARSSESNMGSQSEEGITQNLHIGRDSVVSPVQDGNCLGLHLQRNK
ncbi:hypothetical protein ACI65C_013607 [Semiaphis heraclei]